MFGNSTHIQYYILLLSLKRDCKLKRINIKLIKVVEIENEKTKIVDIVILKINDY